MVPLVLRGGEIFEIHPAIKKFIQMKKTVSRNLLYYIFYMKPLKLKKIVKESFINKKKKRALDSKKMMIEIKQIAKEEFGI